MATTVQERRTFDEKDINTAYQIILNCVLCSLVIITMVNH